MENDEGSSQSTSSDLHQRLGQLVAAWDSHDGRLDTLTAVAVELRNSLTSPALDQLPAATTILNGRLNTLLDQADRDLTVLQPTQPQLVDTVATAATTLRGAVISYKGHVEDCVLTWQDRCDRLAEPVAARSGALEVWRDHRDELAAALAGTPPLCPLLARTSPWR